MRFIGNNFSILRVKHLANILISRNMGSMFEVEKDKFLNMNLEEKRKHYKSGFVSLEEVKTWDVHATDLHLEDDADKKAALSAELNKKVSVWQGDITKLEIDAVVNAANKALKRGGGVDGAIHSAAGAYLQEECDFLNGCAVGEAKLCGGYKLPAKYIIQTVGPQGEKPQKLESCYISSLQLACEHNIRTVAFPCISTGVYGYPQRKACDVAVSSVRSFLDESSDKFDRIIFCVFLPDDKDYYEEIMQQYFPVK